jgi:uncharacterized protein YggU (UPF0235/DUF167 family)
VSGFDTEGRLRVRLTAPPAEGAANDALIKLLARALGVPRSRVKVARGAASRNKLVEVLGISNEDLHAALDE